MFHERSDYCLLDAEYLEYRLIKKSKRHVITETDRKRTRAMKIDEAQK